MGNFPCVVSAELHRHIDAEDKALAEIEACEDAIADAIRSAGGYPAKLFALACDVLGNERVATLLTEALEECDIEIVSEWRRGFFE